MMPAGRRFIRREAQGGRFALIQNVILPKQGLQMTEGFITRWLRKEGDPVKEGEPLFEMETDKLVITIDASCSGKLLKILYPEGSTVPITTVIAYVGEEGDALPEERPEAPAAPATPAEPQAVPAPQPVPAPAEIPDLPETAFCSARAARAASSRHRGPERRPRRRASTCGRSRLRDRMDSL